MSYIIGVDGGGSQTTAVVADLRGRLIARGRSAGANHQIIGMDLARTHIADAIETALHNASIGRHEIAFVVYGLAGADRERDFRILREGLAQLPFDEWDVVCDSWEGLRGGTDDYVGVSLVCGSGTNAVGRNRAGHEVQVGGFGYAFGDTAGGSHLSQATFRAAVRAYQGREEATRLSQAVPAHLGFADMDAVYNHFLDYDTTIPLSLSLVVHEQAASGDAVSQRILAEMGRELGLAANAVMAQLETRPDEELPIVLVGSVLQKGRSPFVLGALEETVHRRFSGAFLQQLDVPPVYGSVLLALDHLGRRPVAESRTTFQGWED